MFGDLKSMILNIFRREAVPASGSAGKFSRVLPAGA